MTLPAPANHRNGRSPLWLQAIALIGVPGVIAFYLLGMIPGTTPPIVQMQQVLKEVREHQEQTRHLLRLTCYATWAHYRDERTADVCWQLTNGEGPPRARPNRRPVPDQPPP